MAFINFAGKESLIVLPNAIAFLSLDNFHIKLLNLLFLLFSFLCMQQPLTSTVRQKKEKKLPFA